MIYGVVLTLLILSLVAAIALSAIEGTKKVKEVFNSLAKQHKGAVKKYSSDISIPGKVRKSLFMAIFPYKETNIYCYQDIVGGGKYGQTWTSASFYLKNSTRIYLKILKNNPVLSISLMRNKTIQKSGNAPFDKEFIIECNDKKFMAELLTHDIKNELLVNKNIVSLGPAIEIKDNYFKAFYTEKGFVTLDKYNKLIDLALRFYDRLKELEYL
ncbi:MAG: hypothetical protein M0R48_06285 [Candidatus Omnitrophica bacterium]|jgi:hypothetical protein|nr:hypothetical protein [Candidatus Omnitrophota bacterium]